MPDLRSERGSVALIRNRTYSVTLFLTEEKDSVTKGNSYGRLECHHHNITTVLSDFNARMGNEAVFRTLVGKFSFLCDLNDRLNFAGG